MDQVVRPYPALQMDQRDQNLHGVHEDHPYQRDQRLQGVQQYPERVRVTVSVCIWEWAVQVCISDTDQLCLNWKIYSCNPMYSVWVCVCVFNDDCTYKINTHSGTSNTNSAKSTRETSQTLKHSESKRLHSDIKNVWRKHLCLRGHQRREFVA